MSSSREMWLSKGGFRNVKGARKGDEDKFMSREELSRLLEATKRDAVYGGWCYDLFALSGNLGLRSIECAGVTLRDFDYLDSHYLVVHTAKQRAKQDDRLYVGADEQSFLEQVFARAKARVRKGHLIFNVPTRSMRAYFSWFAREAGLHPNLSFHSLRHTAARLFLEAARKAGMAEPMRFVMSRLRHKSSMQFGASVLYTRPAPEELIQVADTKGVIL